MSPTETKGGLKVVLDLWRVIAAQPHLQKGDREPMNALCEPLKIAPADRTAFLSYLLTNTQADDRSALVEAAKRFGDGNVTPDAEQAYLQMIQKSRNNLAVYDDVYPSLTSLEQEFGDLYLASNITTADSLVVSQSELINRFFPSERRFYSCEMKVSKDDESLRFWQILIHRIGAPANRCVIIDDRPKFLNCAIESGMWGILLDREREYEEEYTANSKGFEIPKGIQERKNRVFRIEGLRAAAQVLEHIQERVAA